MSSTEISADPHAGTLRSPRFWLAPVVVVTAVMAALAALYIGSMINPADNLHRFPVAIVNQDVGDVLPGSDQQRNLGAEITAAVADGVDPAEIDLQQVGISGAISGLDSGRLYGAIVIPSDFTKRTSILAQGSVIPGDIEKPIITVYTNPRTGTFGKGIVESIADRALTTVNTTVGEQLTTTVTDTLATSAPDLQLSGGSRLTLADPIDVRFVEHKPLPDGTGLGLSAFYYTLLLILAGFTGATIVNSLVDSALGFVPTEYGPWYVDRKTAHLSRFRVLLVKWAIMVILGLIVSALYLWIATLLGMPVTRALLLWEYGALAITAVGVTSISVMAVFGSAGLLVNLLIFIILGLPSSGGTVPLEAMPPLYAWLSTFEPMHQVYIATRAILYFDGSGPAGLTRGVLMTLLGLGIGLVLGAVVTRIYDVRGFHRRSDAEPALVPAQDA
ncbi:YhgE/Pip domain-containing protein [Rhodococcus rhodochrous]|uniref:Membrane protein n=1 Tax=Rhodococcus rhodochrous KG-21 TaxID=1441923 RepID=A0A0M8PKM2_RHORH|nr:DUF3533 domain-containing protein [Rhodococcus rhodochrous]KOS56875.1 membrane protein [Rhodococcus rhodochrous KG-21]